MSTEEYLNQFKDQFWFINLLIKRLSKTIRSESFIDYQNYGLSQGYHGGLIRSFVSFICHNEKKYWSDIYYLLLNLENEKYII